MAYKKRVWGSNEIITKDALNNIENGIEAVEQSIPKKTSQLENDSGYITEHQDLSNYAEKDELHEHNNKNILDEINSVKIQTWNNALQQNDLSNYAEKDELHNHNNKDVLDQIDLARIQTWDSASVGDNNVDLSNYVTKETFEEFVNNSVEHIFITEAEYEALSEEDKNKEDVLYLITDEEDTVINLDNYVTKETFEEFANNSIKHIFITKAEYEDLSEEDKNKEDTLYIITDGETVEEIEYVSLEQYNALLERVEQLEALYKAEPIQDDSDPENPVE